VLAAAGDCRGCHTDIKAKGPELAGGAAIKTKFGTFYAPNITFDKAQGIGTWSLVDFQRAMRKGKGGHGEYLYPAFPYTSFSGMTDADIGDLYAYLRSAPASAQPSKAQEISFPFSVRPLMAFWRVLFFRHGPLAPVAGQTAEWNRGRYLAEAVVHCQECHTPRNLLGAVDKANGYAGNTEDPKAPNITPGSKTVAAYTVDNLVDLLDTGMTPDGDYMGGEMATVVEGTTKLSAADRHAIAVYVKSLPAHASKPVAKPAATAKAAG
jgi:mono/diheme cytochrome c family protein